MSTQQTITPKDIVLKRIAGRDAKRIIVRNYRSGTFPSGVKLCLGAFVGEQCLGCVVFGMGSRFIHTVIADGQPGDVWELARLWLSDRLPKNSESRVLAIAIKVVKKFNRELKAVVTYTDYGVKLYKGAGWEQVPGQFGDTKCMIVDGVEHFSRRAVSNQYGTISPPELRKRGHTVEIKQGVHRTKWIYWLQPGQLAQDANNDKHPLEPGVIKLFRQAPKWLGWPGSETIRKALYDGSYVSVEDEQGQMVGVWLFSRLKKAPVLRDCGCVVDQEQQGKGIGRQLAEKAIALCEEENRVLTFDCKAENPAIEFWRRMNFEETGTRRRGKDQELYRRFVYIPHASRR